MQKILCDTPEKAHQNACHLLEGTICHLLKHCGDEQNRFSDCEFSFNINAILPSVIALVMQHRWLFLPPTILGGLMVGLAIIPELM